LRNLNQDTITQAVIARLADTPDPRLKEVMTNLVQHLHAFARETRLSESEWQAGIEFLTAVGQHCDSQRQEFVLLSDILGLSTLTVTQNNDHPAGVTESTVMGPFYLADAPQVSSGEKLSADRPGQPCRVSGRVAALDGAAIAGAMVEVWHCDGDGLYDVQQEQAQSRHCRGVLQTDVQGHYRIDTIVAPSYPVTADGPVGRLLGAMATHPWRPAHLHFRISAPGFEPLVTHVYREDDPYLDSDVVYGVRESLIVPWVEDEQGRCSFHFDFVLKRSPEPARRAGGRG
jgi:hydroxyquinol 1,2-dioxygenase